MALISTIINDYLRDTGKSANQLAKDSGITAAYIGQLRNGKMTNPSTDKVTKLAKGMGISAAELLSRLGGADSYSNVKNLKDAGFIMVPLFSPLSCGKGEFVDDDADGFVPMPEKLSVEGKRYFANTASGDSMIDANIHDGDVLIFERTDELQNGEIGSFWLNDESYCKTFRQVSDDYVVLESANSDYSPIVVNLHDDSFRIVGRLKYQMAVR